jgi:hypothetical protein
MIDAENGRLRELLRLAGFVDEDIDVWTKREHCENKTDRTDRTVCTRRGDIEQKARLCAAFTAGYKGLAVEEEMARPSRRNKRQREIGAAGNIPESADTRSNTQDPLVEPGSSQSLDADATTAEWPTPATSEAPTDTQAGTCVSPNREVRPCQLLSLLAENPNADITQVPVHPSSVDPLQGTAHHEDVVCGKAYEMLVRYATSEEKMDYISRTLEAGCTSTGQGGCAVKKKVIWEALDSMCG